MKADMEAAKQPAAPDVTYSESEETEEDSPKLGEEFFRAYKAKAQGGTAHIIIASLWKNAF